MINPYVKQDTSAAFADLGIVMDAPEKTENVEYTIIANQMAQIDFTFKGHDYTLRATKKEMDLQAICGYYGDYIASNRLSEAEYYKVNDVFVAGWQREDIFYSCVSDSEEALAEVVEEMLK